MDVNAPKLSFKAIENEEIKEDTVRYVDIVPLLVPANKKYLLFVTEEDLEEITKALDSLNKNRSYARNKIVRKKAGPRIYYNRRIVDPKVLGGLESGSDGRLCINIIQDDQEAITLIRKVCSSNTCKTS
jgi:hypothetical protein